MEGVERLTAVEVPSRWQCPETAPHNRIEVGLGGIIILEFLHFSGDLPKRRASRVHALAITFVFVTRPVALKAQSGTMLVERRNTIRDINP